MHENIRELLSEKHYIQALKYIEKELGRDFNLENAHDEKLFTDLVSLRIAVNSLLGKNDEAVLDLVRKEKFPSEQKYRVDKNKILTLLYKNSFLINSDAYIHSIHQTKLWKYSLDSSSRSASKEFLNRLGEDFIYNQIEIDREYKLGDFILLSHPQLNAPFSYHILCYQGSQCNLDLDALSEGLQNVLKDITKKKLELVSLFPLGYEAVVQAKKDDKNNVAETITDKIVEVIIQYLWKTPEEFIPNIYFGAVTTKTYHTFDRVLYRWSKEDKTYIEYVKNIKNNQLRLIQEARTKDPEYIEELEKLSHYMNEDTTILILGETGVGKSYLARLIDKYSYRKSQRMESINCALLKSERVYTILFGWKKGSFTNAITDGVGLIEKAENGTLFLDEIGYVDLDVQKSLLTFLDEGTYRRYGDPIERKANVKLIFGTNQDLLFLVNSGLFQPDFYERIAQRVLTIPPLRKRPEDIELFIKWMQINLKAPQDYNIHFDKKALKALKSFSWPGNIRQLQYYTQNLIQDAYYSKRKVISSDIVLKNPPRNSLYYQKTNLELLEQLLKEFIKNWDGSKGKLNETILEPILAKIYLNDLGQKRTDASRILGIDASRGNNSTLLKRLDNYPKIKDILDNLHSK
ncbi:sigma-54-dependent transcriptional regulator [candidate division KSB1 bacterium]